MKKLACLLMALVMVLAMATAASAEWKFERKIDIVCPWGVGGGADSTIRPMAQLLQSILGVPVEVVNVEGAGGVNGVEYTYKQPADGYTFMLGTQSLFMQDMQGTTSMDFKTEFECVDVLVHSINIIAASKKSMERYGVSNWSELSEYIQNNPWTVSVGMLTATGVDGASLAQAIEGMDLLEVSYAGGSELNSALVGGHCDLAISGTDEIAGLIESGDIIPILALCENRMSVFPMWSALRKSASTPTWVRGAASSPRPVPRRKPSTRWSPPLKKRAPTNPGSPSSTTPPMTSAKCPPPAKRPKRLLRANTKRWPTTSASRACFPRTTTPTDV